MAGYVFKLVKETFKESTICYAVDFERSFTTADRSWVAFHVESF